MVYLKNYLCRDNESNFERNKVIDTIFVDNIEEEIDLLKIPPSVWTKLYRRELIIDNNISFPHYICGEDMVFALEAF